MPTSWLLHGYCVGVVLVTHRFHFYRMSVCISSHSCLLKSAPYLFSSLPSTPLRCSLLCHPSLRRIQADVVRLISLDHLRHQMARGPTLRLGPLQPPGPMPIATHRPRSKNGRRASARGIHSEASGVGQRAPNHAQVGGEGGDSSVELVWISVHHGAVLAAEVVGRGLDLSGRECE